jgi:hypothetical protein
VTRQISCSRLLCLGLLGLILLGSNLLPAPARAEEPTLEPGEFDPSAWDSLLRMYAGPEGVDYASWREDGTEELDAFLAAAAEWDLGSILAKEPKAAFLVNAYNAWAVRQVLEHPALESPLEIEGFLEGNSFPLAGGERTLDDIETLLEPYSRILPETLLCLCPAMRGAAQLPSLAYTSENLIELVTLVVQDLLVTREGAVWDPETRKLELPASFDRHGEFFAAQRNGLAGTLSRYLSLSVVVSVTEGNAEITYFPPNAELNRIPMEETR